MYIYLRITTNNVKNNQKHLKNVCIWTKNYDRIAWKIN